MASGVSKIFDINMQNYAFSSTGELGTKSLATCVAVIVIFADNTVMMEHRSDAELCAFGNKDEAIELFGSIVANIQKVKEENCVIR
jgi:hypothetical protein